MNLAEKKFEKIGFWNMPCVKISINKQRREVKNDDKEV